MKHPGPARLALTVEGRLVFIEKQGRGFRVFYREGVPIGAVRGRSGRWAFVRAPGRTRFYRTLKLAAVRFAQNPATADQICDQ